MTNLPLAVALTLGLTQTWIFLFYFEYFSFKKTNTTICIEYMPETLSKTYIKKYSLNEQVNLELALTLSTPLGGHLVTGHIDETGFIKRIHTTKEWTEITI